MERRTALHLHGSASSSGSSFLTAIRSCALTPHVERQRAGDEDRGIGADDDADDDREREARERLAAEEYSEHDDEQHARSWSSSCATASG